MIYFSKVNNDEEYNMLNVGFIFFSIFFSLYCDYIIANKLVGMVIRKGIHLKIFIWSTMYTMIYCSTNFGTFDKTKNSYWIYYCLFLCVLLLLCVSYNAVMLKVRWYYVLTFSFFSTTFVQLLIQVLYLPALLFKLIFKFNYEPFLTCFTYFLLFFSLVVVGIICDKKSRRPLRAFSVLNSFFLYILILSNLIICLLLEKYLYYKPTTWGYAAVTIASILMAFQVFGMIYLIDAKNVYKEHSRINQNYLKLQEEHYEALIEKDLELRKFRHDMIHHMNVLKALYGQGKEEELWSYAGKIDDFISPQRYIIYTNNRIVDSIVNHFALEAGKKGIQIKVSGHMPENCRIENFDICTIFANILSNAMEATAEYPGEDKNIQLGIRYDDTRIYIKEENPFLGEIVMEDILPVSKKQDQLKHGIGLKNVKDCIKKYKGDIIFDFEKNNFKIMIAIDN